MQKRIIYEPLFYLFKKKKEYLKQINSSTQSSPLLLLLLLNTIYNSNNCQTGNFKSQKLLKKETKK